MRWQGIVLLFLFTAQPAVAQAASGLGRFHAVVIGNQNYRHLTVLRTPIADAKAVDNLLRAQYGFTVDLLLDKSRDEIMSALFNLRKTMTKEEDNLLIYYAGHGYLDEASGAGYWQAIDAEKDSLLHWIPTTEVSNLLKAIPARHVLVVADSCYSGSLLTRDSGAKLPVAMNKDEWLKRAQKKRSRTALTSGGEEPVADGGGGDHSVFAKAFLEALRENQGILDGDSLFDRIKRPVALNAEQTPLYRDIRMTGHEDGADFLFVPKSLQGDATEKEADKPVVDLSHLKRGDEPQEKVTEQPIKKEEPVVAAKHKQGDTMKEPITGMEFVHVPGGCFKMGSSENNRDPTEGKVHEVCLGGFWMGKYEVTQGQWKKIMGSNPSDFKKGDTYPVEQVSWEDAKEFIAKLNKKLPAGTEFRLPTEAEWEYACRANGSGNYCGGNDVDALAWYGEGLNGSSHPVGEKKANSFGLHDMSGNLWEWCSDLYDSASKSDKEEETSNSPRVIRGGGWGDASEYVRATIRDKAAANFRGNLVGFRLVLGKEVNKIQQQQLNQMHESSPSGTVLNWVNPDNGKQYQVIPQPAYMDSVKGQTCRKAEMTAITENGENKLEYVTVCRDANGNWQLQE